VCCNRHLDASIRPSLLSLMNLPVGISWHSMHAWEMCPIWAFTACLKHWRKHWNCNDSGNGLYKAGIENLRESPRVSAAISDFCAFRQDAPLHHNSFGFKVMLGRNSAFWRHDIKLPGTGWRQSIYATLGCVTPGGKISLSAPSKNLPTLYSIFASGATT